MPFPKQSVDPPLEVDEYGSLGTDYADAVRMGRWVVAIVAVLVAAMLTYDYTSYSTVANLVSFSHPSTTGALPASHKVNPARSPAGPTFRR
jgi:hypothetical protein